MFFFFFFFFFGKSVVANSWSVGGPGQLAAISSLEMRDRPGVWTVPRTVFVTATVTDVSSSATRVSTPFGVEVVADFVDPLGRGACCIVTAAPPAAAVSRVPVAESCGLASPGILTMWGNLWSCGSRWGRVEVVT